GHRQGGEGGLGDREGGAGGGAAGGARGDAGAQAAGVGGGEAVGLGGGGGGGRRDGRERRAGGRGGPGGVERCAGTGGRVLAARRAQAQQEGLLHAAAGLVEARGGARALALVQIDDALGAQLGPVLVVPARLAPERDGAPRLLACVDGPIN